MKSKERNDKATFWRDRRLKLLVLENLYMNKLKSQNRRGLRNQKNKISERHPFYIVALIKKRCGTLRDYLSAPETLLDKQ